MYKILAAILLMVSLVSCPTTPTSAAKKKDTAASTVRAFNALNSVLAPSGASASVRPQATTSITATCNVGSITYTLSSTNTTLTFNLSTSAGGCKQGNTTVSTGQGGFTFVLSTTTTPNAGSFSTTYNGSITVNDGSGTDSLSFSNFSFTINFTGTGASISYTVVMNGTVSANGESVTFNNETYTYTDLGL